MSSTDDLSDGFFAQTKAMSKRLGCNPVDALKVWFSESIGIDASAKNPRAAAYGINQMMSTTLTGVGFTRDPADYLTLGAEGQLPYVEKYYFPYKGRLTSAMRLYQVNFLPATFNSVTESGDKLAVKDGVRSWAYDSNKALDPDSKGYITLGDLQNIVERAVTNTWKWKGGGSMAGRWKEILERLTAAPDPAP